MVDSIKLGSVDPNDIPFATTGLDVPTIYADHIRGAMFSQGVFKINLVENRVNAKTDEICAIHTATIIVPLIQVQAWGKFLSDVAADWELQNAGAPEPDGEPA